MNTATAPSPNANMSNGKPLLRLRCTTSYDIGLGCNIGGHDHASCFLPWLLGAISRAELKQIEIELSTGSRSSPSLLAPIVRAQHNV